MAKGSSRAQAIQFRDAIGAAEYLQLKAGLQAIKSGEGRGQITAANPAALLGSVMIDDDCRRPPFAQDPRWDYVVGYARGRQAIAHFIEVHSAETSNVADIDKKLRWLRDFLLRDRQKKLAALPREYHWVASGRVNIPKHLPQFRFLNTTLRKIGLRGPMPRLALT